jgi:ankyrin repeat protein
MTQAWNNVEDVLRALADEYPFDDNEPFEPKLIPLNSTESTGDTPIHIMCHRDDITAVKLLVEAGAQINYKGDMEYTPLHIASRRASYELVEYLLNQGASVEASNGFGHTALDIAKERGDDNIVKLLTKFKS